MKRVLLFFLFIIFAIWLQRLFPNSCVDLLLPAIVVSLEFKKFYFFLLVSILWIVIQEGAGFLIFGSSILVLSSTIVAFYLYKKFFSFTSLFFTFLFTVTVLVCQFLAITLVSYLQGIELDIFFVLRRELNYLFVFEVFLYLDFLIFKYYIFKSQSINNAIYFQSI